MRLLAPCVAAAVVVLCAGTASAGPGITLSSVAVDPQHRAVDLTVSTAGLPPGVGLDAESVRVRVGSRTVPATASPTANASLVRAPSVLLVVDTSGSMLGQPLTDAKRALNQFVADAPDAARIGLLRFSTQPQLLVPPATDRTRLLAAVASLQAQGETALHDALTAGLQVLGPDGDRRLVVLSDGGDTRSRSSLSATLREIRQSGIVVDAIAFNTGESVTGVLRTIATTGHGVLRRADSADALSAALQSSVRSYARSLTVHVLLPEDVHGQQQLTALVSTAEGHLRSSTTIDLGGPTSTPARVGFWGSHDALLMGCIAIGISLLLASLALLGDHRRREARQARRLVDRFTTASPTDKDVRTASPVARRALELAEQLATRRDVQDELALRLDRAAVSMTPAEWLLLQAGLCVIATFVLVLLGMNLLVGLVLGGVLGGVLPGRVLAFRGRRRQKAFEDKLPDMLQMTAGSLSAGYSLAQALDGVVREGSEPMAAEIGRALAESRLGIAVEDTLEQVAGRMASRDFGWVVMAIRVQREVGGNLAGILTTVSATMRERAMLRRHVRGLSAEGRLSAYILLGLPVFLALYMLTLRRTYIHPLYTTALGIVLIVVALVLLGIGSFWMSRMVKVEV